MRLYSYFLLIILFIAACNKNEVTPVVNVKLADSVIGKWKVISSEEKISYLEFDKNLNFTTLQVDSQFNTRSFSSYKLVNLTEDFITFSFYNQCDYSYSKNTLIIYKEKTSDILYKCIRDTLAPAINEWMSIVNPIDAADVPFNNYTSDNDIGFDGKNILLARDEILNDDGFYQYNIATREFNFFKTSVSSDNSAPIYVSNYYWLSIPGFRKLIKIDPVSGNELERSKDSFFEFTTQGTASSEDTIMLFSNSGYLVYKISSNTWSNHSVGISFEAIEYVNGYLYGIKNNYLYKFDLKTNKSIKSYSFNNILKNQNDKIRGLVFDGKYFWINLYNLSSKGRKLYKLDSANI